METIIFWATEKWLKLNPLFSLLLPEFEPFIQNFIFFSSTNKTLIQFLVHLIEKRKTTTLASYFLQWSICVPLSHLYPKININDTLFDSSILQKNTLKHHSPIGFIKISPYRIITKIYRSYLKGLANTLCPIVTKLVSWFDINHARDDTLPQTQARKINDKYLGILIYQTYCYQRLWRNWWHQMIPAGKYVLSNSKNWWISYTIMFFVKLLQQIPHFQSFFQVIILLNECLAIETFKCFIFLCYVSMMKDLIHINCLQAFSSGENNSMILIFWLPFTQHCRSWKLYFVNYLHKNNQTISWKELWATVNKTS